MTVFNQERLPVEIFQIDRERMVEVGTLMPISEILAES